MDSRCWRCFFLLFITAIPSHCLLPLPSYPEENDSEPLDLMVIGAGIAGMSTAKAAVERRMSVQVLEQGVVCGQGATAAAKQGQVNAYEPSSPRVLEGWGHEGFALRWQSLRIYQHMTQLGYDLGLVEHGGAQIFFEGNNIFSTIRNEYFAWLGALALSFGKGTTTEFIEKDLCNSREFECLAATYDSQKGRVDPCKVLKAWKDYISVRGGSVQEKAETKRIDYDQETGIYTLTLESGKQYRSRALVVAVGTWHDKFMKAHFPSQCANTLSIKGLAGMIQVFNVTTPIRYAAPILLSTDSPLMEIGMLAPPSSPCDAWRPQGHNVNSFTSSCRGQVWARYLYAANLGGTMFSAGTRREAIEDVEDCHSTTHAAPKLPWSEEQAEWAMDAAIKGFRISGHNVSRIENYSACFPVAQDSQEWLRELKCTGFERLFVLNGLAGSGIARGPGAGKYVSDQVAAALGKGPASNIEFRDDGGDEQYDAETLVIRVGMVLLVLTIALLTCCGSALFYIDFMKLQQDIRDKRSGDNVKMVKPSFRQDITARSHAHNALFVVVATMFLIVTILAFISFEARLILFGFMCVVFIGVFILMVVSCCPCSCLSPSTSGASETRHLLEPSPA